MSHSSWEVPAISKSRKRSDEHQGKTVKLVIAGTLFVAAVIVGYVTLGGDHRMESENNAGLAGVNYRIECAGCRHVFEMPAVDYNNKEVNGSVKCPKCGERRAYPLGDAANVDPEQFKAEVDAMRSISEVRAARSEAEEKEASLLEQLASPEVANDAARTAALKKELATVKARITAIERRWDELQS